MTQQSLTATLWFRQEQDPSEYSCYPCFQNRKHLRCALLMPKCGSFSSVVEVTMLPTISKVGRALLHDL